MYDYRLLYDTPEEGFVDLELGDETPAMNYQINRLGELKERQAAYSQAISLPLTDDNLRTLGFIDRLDAIPTAARELRRCQLLCDGAVLSPPAAVLYVDAVEEDAIRVQIASGVKDLFEQMGESDERPVMDDSWVKYWSAAQVADDNGNDNGFRWPLVFAHRGVRAYDPAVRYGLERVQLLSLVPCYHLPTMIRTLFAQYGYDIESDLLDDELIGSLYVSGSDVEYTQHGRALTTFAQQRIRIPVVGNTSGFVHSIHPEPMQADDFAGNTWGRDNDMMRFYPMQPGEYAITAEVTNTGSVAIGSSPVSLRWELYRGTTPADGAETVTLESSESLTIAPGMKKNIEIDTQQLNVGEFIGFRLVPMTTTNSSAIGTTADFLLQVDFADDEPAPGPRGVPFNFIRATGFKNNREIARSFLWLFGAMIDTKQRIETTAGGRYVKGTARIYTFAELYKRLQAGQTVDWSQKLILDDEHTATFTIGDYAQRNYIELEENAEDDTSDSASFRIPDRTLEARKTLFTLPIEAGRDIAYTFKDENGYDRRRTVAVIPTLSREVTEDDQGSEIETLEYEGCGPHLLRLTGEEAQVLNVSGFRQYQVRNGVTDEMTLPVAVTQPFGPLFEKYYAPLVKMLQNVRVLTASFDLDVVDIERLDLLTPVYVKRYGCYFYISKISNFVAGEPTRVELVKM